jgi:hypothetical protein
MPEMNEQLLHDLRIHFSDRQWSMYCGHVQQFETIDDALAHGAAVLGDNRFDVLPVLDMSLPTHRDVREDNPRARLIGTEIVKEH